MCSPSHIELTLEEDAPKVKRERSSVGDKAPKSRRARQQRHLLTSGTKTVAE